MYKTGIFLIISFVLTSCSVSKDPQRKTARLLQQGKLKEDTSWIYQLPYKPGTAHRLIQGYFSRFSHKNRAALDFKMKKGTEVFAARDGVVVRLQEQNDKGGWNKKYRTYANFVVIEHSDGTRAGYWHLQKDGVLVNMGDSVKTGQLIALSGNTGYSATPHLHFMIWKSNNGRWTQIPSRFMTKKGARYLRPLRRYKHPT
jgi:murein DD-endopeptidase MepM/ murein hydrolase activator NlpD